MSGLSCCALRSGSSGNSTFFCGPDGRVLVDLGINGRSFVSALQEISFPEDLIHTINGILVTHEHRDHIAGLGVIMRRYKLPVYMNRKTFEAAVQSLGKVDLNLIHLIYPEEAFELGGFHITPFRTSHDAADPMAYTLENEHGKVAICTDLGIMQEHIMSHLRGSRLVYIEANFEPQLLASGPYPAALKARIRGERGHLSNEDCARVCADLIQGGTEQFMLSHLSRENNYPDMARLVVRQGLEAVGAVENSDYRLDVSRRYKASELVRLD